jgi:hypothetical protein
MKTLPNLTLKESKFLAQFLSENGCLATNSSQLLEDNFSCQCVKDMMDWKYSKNEIAGYISSLESKNVIMIETRSGREPDLYWVNDWYLEELVEFGNQTFNQLVKDFE